MKMILIHSNIQEILNKNIYVTSLEFCSLGSPSQLKLNAGNFLHWNGLIVKKMILLIYLLEKVSHMDVVENGYSLYV